MTMYIRDTIIAALGTVVSVFGSPEMAIVFFSGWGAGVGSTVVLIYIYKRKVRHEFGK